MKLLICSVFDQAVGAYLQPFFARSKAEAIRSFSDAVGTPKSPFCEHPSDYTLVCLGAFNDADGEVVASQMIEKLITGLECRATAENGGTVQ